MKIGSWFFQTQNTLFDDSYVPNNRIFLYLIEGFFLTSFVLLSVLLAVGRWRGVTPYVYLDSDASVYASAVTATINPSAFQSDPLLADPYTLKIAMTRLSSFIVWVIVSLTGLDVGTTHMLVLGPLVFVQVLGFYLLGREVSGSRYWSYLFTIALILPGYGWGTPQDITGSFLFQALFPFLLLLALKLSSKPQLWAVLFATLGLTIYVHPTSSPPVAFGLWLAMWVFVPKDWSVKRRMLFMLAMGFIYILFILPYFFVYSGGDRANIDAKDYQLVYSIVLTRWPLSWLDGRIFLAEYFSGLVKSGYIVALIFGAVIIFWRRCAIPSRSYLTFLIFWMVGLVGSAFLVSYTDQAVSKQFARLPFQFEMIRPITYLYPIIILLFFVAMQALQRLRQEQVWLWSGVALSVILFGLYGIQNPSHILKNELSCLIKQQHIFCPEQLNSLEFETVAHIRDHTPKNATILSNIDLLSIRYYSERSLRFAYKDGSTFIYSHNADKIIWWHENNTERSQIDGITNKGEQIAAWVRFSCKLQADYFILWLAEPSEATQYLTFAKNMDLDVVFNNEQAIVFSIVNCNPVSTQSR